MILSLVLIPPWQQPDEPGQVAVAEVFQGRLSAVESVDPAREAEILQSMATYDWWRHYGQATPPIPERFERLTGSSLTTLGISFTSSNIPRLYYAFVARVLAVAPDTSVVYDLYVMRALSAVFGMLTLWVAWCAARESLGDTGGAIVAVLLALQTQFALVSTTASPDSLVNLAGACLWWQSMRAVRGPALFWPLTAVWGAAAFAAMADRMGVPLLVIACAVSIIAVVRTGLRGSSVTLVVSAVGLLAASLWLLNAYLRLFGMYEMWDRVIPMPQALSWDFFATFTSVLFGSWWASLGWLRYSPPSWWIAIAVVLSVGAGGGAMWRAMREDDGRMRMVIGVALMMVLTEIAIVYWVYFRIAHGPEGRHVFPTLVPALVLMWVGIEAWAPPRYRSHAAVGLVLAFALLDAAVWILVAAPAYAG